MLHALNWLSDNCPLGFLCQTRRTPAYEFNISLDSNKPRMSSASLPQRLSWALVWVGGSDFIGQ